MVFLISSPNMLGIEKGGQHCYLNALLQCMSVNNRLVNALTVHPRNHVAELCKYNSTTILLNK